MVGGVNGGASQGDLTIGGYIDLVHDTHFDAGQVAHPCVGVGVVRQVSAVLSHDLDTVSAQGLLELCQQFSTAQVDVGRPLVPAGGQC